jgi:hypothetical protein
MLYSFKGYFTLSNFQTWVPEQGGFNLCTFYNNIVQVFESNPHHRWVTETLQWWNQYVYPMYLFRQSLVLISFFRQVFGVPTRQTERRGTRLVGVSAHKRLMMSRLGGESRERHAEDPTEGGHVRHEDGNREDSDRKDGIRKTAFANSTTMMIITSSTTRILTTSSLTFTTSSTTTIMTNLKTRIPTSPTESVRPGPV